MSEDVYHVEAIKHFEQVARRGAVPGASRGEKIAHELARAFHSIGDDAALLDSNAIIGARILLQLMAGPWPHDQAKAAVFQTVRRAAGH